MAYCNRTYTIPGLKWCFFFILLMSWMPVYNQYVFQINNFKAFDADLNLEGSAMFRDDALRVCPAQPMSHGGAWYSKEKIDLVRGFETEFSFLISGQDASGGGDGFAFVIQNQDLHSGGGTGDAIGYKEIPFGLAIEFDTKNDGEGSKNHICLTYYEESTGSYRRYATVHEIPEIQDGVPHITKINYLDGNLQVYLDSYLFPVLSVRIDIAKQVKSTDGQAWVGFTSATSSSYAHHDLLTWHLREELPPPEDIDEAKISVEDAEVIVVYERKLRIRVWDHNKIDGDIISLKWGDQWVVIERELKAEPYEIELTLHGFSQRLVLFANNIGLIPPNTASIAVWTGENYKQIELEADMEKSEALIIRYEQK